MLKQDNGKLKNDKNNNSDSYVSFLWKYYNWLGNICPYYNCPLFGDCEQYPDECDEIKRAKDLANELEFERKRDLKLEKIKEEK